MTLYRKISLDSAATARRVGGYRAALDSCNRDRMYLNARNQDLLRQEEGLHASLDETTSRLETTTTELRHWKPRTKAGVFLRKVRNGLAIVGGGVIGITILRLIAL